ncbi:hypothetical protein [Psychrobacter sp. DAB_AL43B]|uniref:hypothetical protein n=1 Tax=Psychrobacter sp. DAB_AL43B TaxID=1028416 RepID=UPI0009C1C53C|nr:hypothetical protein [Psychrobacter sp. DAB_AL43B]SLJ84478.1 hypothetical protein DABAL43B_1282 [Psychrobacter sp. DAB_AL43B]
MSYQLSSDLHVMMMRVDSTFFARYRKSDIGLFYVYDLAGIAMCDLSNAEVFNRWKHSKKKTAKDYWYDFLKSRADRNYPGAEEYVNKMYLVK